MKRVRYLAGAAGLTPMVVGAVAGGGAHAAADVTGHHKTVASPTAAVGVTGHGKTVAPYTRAYQGRIIPDIRGEPCSSIFGQDWLKINYSSFLGHVNHACFAQGGGIGLNYPNFDSLYTGNNRAIFSLYYNGRSIGCRASQKDRWYGPCGGVPKNKAEIIYLDIY